MLAYIQCCIAKDTR